MAEKFAFTNFILLMAYKMAVAVTDSLNYHLDTARGRTTLQALFSSLTNAGVINVTTHQAEATLTADGPDRAGAINMGSADSTFTDTRKVALSLTSSQPLLFTTTLKTITIHMMPDPINPRFLRIYTASRNQRNSSGDHQAKRRKVEKPKPEEQESMPMLHHCPHAKHRGNRVP
jgi:hypothetical protein